MACENAINATDLLRDEVRSSVGQDEWEALAAAPSSRTPPSTASCRARMPAAGLDVTVEPFCEWAIESGPFGGRARRSSRAPPSSTTWRRTSSASSSPSTPVTPRPRTTASRRDRQDLRRARRRRGCADASARVLEETCALLVAKHGFDAEVQRAYREKILVRFANPHLPDTVERVGRQPLRKLRRHERFIGPAAELAERGIGRRARSLDAVGRPCASTWPTTSRASSCVSCCELADRRGVRRAGHGARAGASAVRRDSSAVVAGARGLAADWRNRAA